MLALIEGVSLAVQHGLVPLKVETDCQVLVDALQTRILRDSNLGFLMDDLREGLRTASAANLSFVRRSANRVAHSLAQAALHTRINLGFSIVPLLFVEELISDEYCNDP
ncbi:PREDICTED: uncharacterized protein LOC101293741 [Fragaria vesca subsp. vesca]